MKQKIMVTAAIIMASFTINTIHAQTVNDKIQAKFQKAFPAAEQTTWVALKTGYEARFSQNGVGTVVGYNRAGREDYMIEHYNADKLPSSISNRINDIYKEYDIVDVTEVHLNGETGYLVNIESKKFRKAIRINGDDMDVYKDVAISSR